MLQLKINKFYIAILFTQDGFFQITIPPGTYEVESIIEENKRNGVEESDYTEGNYPFYTKPNVSTLGSIIKNSNRRPLNSFVHDDSIRYLLEFDPIVIPKNYNLSTNPVDILSFDNCFLANNMLQWSSKVHDRAKFLVLQRI